MVIKYDKYSLHTLINQFLFKRQKLSIILIHVVQATRPDIYFGQKKKVKKKTLRNMIKIMYDD